MTVTEAKQEHPAQAQAAAPALSREEEFIRKKFAEHYSRTARYLTVKAIVQREFGFGWRDKIDVRHKAFLGQRDLANFFQKEAPKYASYSTAYYALPAARPMEHKQYLGCDLVFDFDLSYEGQPKEKPHEHNKLLCAYCLQRSKEDAIRLMEEVLVNDFGLAASEVYMNFSGSKGFHVHVESDAVKELNANARRQLISYITGEGIDKMVSKTGVGDSRAQVLRGPGGKSKGWAGKLFKVALGMVADYSEEEFKNAGVPPGKAKKIAENRAFILNLMKQGNWDAVKGLDKLWSAAVQRTLEKHALSIDKNVTLDVARLIRIPNTLHGDTGLIAARVTKPSLFDPLKHATAFKYGFVRLKPTVECKLELDGQTVEVRKDFVKDFPTSAAMLLLCRKAATLV
jgi:DNA primase small subunit